MNRMVDSHCHLADSVFADDLAMVVERASAAGVDRALCILSAHEPEELARTAVVRSAWPAVLFAAAIHPHHAGAYEGRIADAADVTRQAVAASGADVVGELGLDYHYEHAPRAVQREVLAAQLEVAATAHLPVAIHTREAFDDTASILEAAGRDLRGVMHCFSGSVAEARRALDLGFFISIAGIVTFPKAGNVRDLAAFVPDDRLLVETDAPFLAPVPHRGHRNEPAWVVETARVLARLRGTPLDRLTAALDANFDRFLGGVS